ncbi:bifunctional DNA primase/polymerase [Streptomyces sp. NPDC005374]|uniref:bifunctional DNA primase/polymerase n=1 Tax=Streptomyces sp. NPDC005374 TaxID=3364713 RepID=UPI0036A6E55E
MISTDKFADVFGAVPAGDTEKLINLAVLAVRNGFAIVLDKPGEKVPLCPLTKAQRTRADTDAQEAAKDAGDERWAMRKHACSYYHAFTDAEKLRRVLKRLIASGITPNLGVQPRLSRMIVVDVDTAAEQDAFLLAWSEATGTDMTSMKPTVLTPGAQNPDGTWKHRDGGHYWFAVPEDFELPTNIGKTTGDGGWVIAWGDTQVLVPPSSRPEGAYKLIGQSMQLPDWLREFIAQRAKRAGDHEPAGDLRLDADDPTNAWAAKHPWTELLTAHGWTDTGRTDSSCGCPIWTAPGGEHHSWKSATAHGPGCGLYPENQTNAVLHLWTDNPPEELAACGKNVTKLNFVAYTRHDGNVRAAMEALGIVDEIDDDAKGDTEPVADAMMAQASNGWDFLSPGEPDEPPLWGNADVAALWQSGESLFLFGPPGAGKSTLAHLVVFGYLGLIPDVLGFPVTDDGRRVGYLAMDRPKQIKRAMRRLVRPEHEAILKERLIARRGPLPVNVVLAKNRDYLRDWALREGIGVIVIDSIKDVLPNASDEEAAGHYNQVRQSCLAAGIEWIELHHNRKANGLNKEPNTLEDVYGSRWLTAGAGSVISLWQDEPGSPVISLRHIRAAGERWRDTTLILDMAEGTLSVESELTLEDFAASHRQGFTVAEAATALHGPKPSRGDKEAVRNKIKRMEKRGALEIVLGSDDPFDTEIRYRPTPS